MFQDHLMNLLLRAGKKEPAGLARYVCEIIIA